MANKVRLVERCMAYTIKISFQGMSRDVQFEVPPSLVDLQRVVTSTFKTARDNGAHHGDQLYFTYFDGTCGDFTFKTDSELEIALRACLGRLPITATPAGFDREVGE